MIGGDVVVERALASTIARIKRLGLNDKVEALEVFEHDVHLGAAAALPVVFLALGVMRLLGLGTLRVGLEETRPLAARTLRLRDYVQGRTVVVVLGALIVVGVVCIVVEQVAAESRLIVNDVDALLFAVFAVQLEAEIGFALLQPTEDSVLHIELDPFAALPNIGLRHLYRVQQDAAMRFGQLVRLDRHHVRRLPFPMHVMVMPALGVVSAACVRRGIVTVGGATVR